MQKANDRLVAALEKLPESPARERLLVRARAFVYDDFKTTIAMPKAQLIADLGRCGFQELVQRTMLGEFDADAIEAREWFASLPEGERLQVERIVSLLDKA